MADTPLYEGDTVRLHWGKLRWTTRVFRSDEFCVHCGGATVRLEPPWQTWSLLCCTESALVTTEAEHRDALDRLAPGAIGLVSAVPVRVKKGGTHGDGDEVAEVP